MNKITKLVKRIPEESCDEAFDSIETIVITENIAKIRCNLTNEFRLFVQANRNGTIKLSAEHKKEMICTENEFLSALRCYIYEIDEDIAENRYQQSPLKARVTFIDNPPVEMDIPVWDEKTKTWYDAEY